MTMNVESNSAALASSDDMAARFDVRSLEQLCSDLDAPVGSTQLSSNTRLGTALKAATGRLESACTAGNRYTPTDLATLATSATVSAEHLKDVICGLAMGRLILSRPDVHMELPPEYQDAQEELKSLRSGAAIFSFAETQQADNLDLTIDSPDVARRRKLPSELASRFFGQRGSQFDQQP